MRPIRAAAAALLAVLAIAPPALAHERPLPAAWHLYCNMGDDYQAGITDIDSHSGRWCGFVKSGLTKPRGFADVDQGFKADRYRGKRLRYSAWVKTIGVKGHADLWMRVDGPDHKVLAFDGMQGRRLAGSSGWKRYEIVLDVPPESEKVAFGMVLDGEGAVCFDDVKFEVVGKNVATTNLVPHTPDAPRNLDFEK